MPRSSPPTYLKPVPNPVPDMPSPQRDLRSRRLRVLVACWLVYVLAFAGMFALSSTHAARKGATQTPASTAGAPQATTTSAHASPISVGARVSALPIISRGAPVFASTTDYPAQSANDADYATVWRSVTPASLATPQWLAFDLSSVPQAQRRAVVFAWYNDATGEYYLPAQSYSLPRNYVIEGNAAAGGGMAPTAGWVELTKVSDNVYSRREHALNLANYNWVRMRVTATSGGSGNDDVALQVDVQDASQPNQDNWLFLGDSITMEGFGHFNINNSPWTGGGYQTLIHQARPSYSPIVLNGGVGGTTMKWANEHKDALLAPFVGHYVGIAYGTNDVNQVAPLTPDQISQYYSNVLGVVDAVTARGMVPVVSSVPWGCANNGQLGANAKLLNQYLDQHLLVDRPAVKRGPDVWTYFHDHPTLLRDCIHPTYSAASGQLNGYEQLQRLWRDAMLTAVYGS